MRDAARTERFPLSRIGTLDVGVIGRSKHHMMGLLEVDVTAAREQLRVLRRGGNQLSFMSWFVHCVAKTVEELPEAHAVLAGRRRKVLFEDVDITLLVERRMGGEVVPLPVVLRRCQAKSASDIESEITEARTQPIEGPEDLQLGKRRPKFLVNAYYLLPQFLRVWIIRRLLKNPRLHKETMGTVVITSLAAGLRFPGWVVPKSMHNLVFALGSIVRKPAVLGDQVLPRDVLHLTVLLDHDVVDGAPAARFVSRLVKRLESSTPAEADSTG